MRKVYVEVKTKIIMIIDDGVPVSDVMNEMEYNYRSNDDRVTVEDMEMLNYEVKDSK